MIFPGSIWLTAGAVAVASTVAFATGWKVNGWRLTDHYETAWNKANDQYTRTVEEYAAALELAQRTAAKAASEHQQKVSELSQRIQKLKLQRPTYVTQETNVKDHPFTVGFVHELNSVSNAATPAPVPTGKEGGDPTGILGDPTATSTVTRDELIDWYAEVAVAYGKCREQILSLRSWKEGG